MLNFCLYKPCAMCLSLLHFQPCAGGEPDCNCCLTNKYTYLQLRSPEVKHVLPQGLRLDTDTPVLQQGLLPRVPSTTSQVPEFVWLDGVVPRLLPPVWR